MLLVGCWAWTEGLASCRCVSATAAAVRYLLLLLPSSFPQVLDALASNLMRDWHMTMFKSLTSH
jgi:hypothetical protein